MSEQNTPKRGRGRPPKAKVAATTTLSSNEGQEVHAKDTNEGANGGENAPEMPQNDPKTDGFAGVQTANTLPAPAGNEIIQAGNTASWDEFMRTEGYKEYALADPDQEEEDEPEPVAPYIPIPIVLPNGDVEVILAIRETYAQALLDQAREQGKTLTEHMQELLDWWVEQEFVIAPRV